VYIEHRKKIMQVGKKAALETKKSKTLEGTLAWLPLALWWLEDGLANGLLSPYR
jgi:hypothetical protein